MSHTILLVQLGTDKGTRTYNDYVSVSKCMEDIVGTFERELQRLNPGRANLAYAAVDVQRWLDTLHDITALTFSEEKASYVPHDRHWVRQRVQQWVEKHT